MNLTKNWSVYLLLLFSNISCDSDQKPEVTTDNLKPANINKEPVKKELLIKESPISLDLSLPEESSNLNRQPDITKSKEKTPETIRDILNKNSKSNYKISGDIHLRPDNDNNELLLEKVDGGQINIEIEFEQ